MSHENTHILTLLPLFREINSAYENIRPCFNLRVNEEILTKVRTNCISLRATQHPTFCDYNNKDTDKNPFITTERFLLLKYGGFNMSHSKGIIFR